MSCLDIKPCTEWVEDTREECHKELTGCRDRDWQCDDWGDCSWNPATWGDCINGVFCRAGHYFCKAANKIYELVCEVVTVLVEVACVVAGAVVNAVCDFFVWLWQLVTAALGCLFSKRTSRNIAEDVVPNFMGLNFKAKDEYGNEMPFIWGASTASYQVEGHIANSDWSIFNTSPDIKWRVELHGNIGGTTLQLEDADNAVDHRILDVFIEDVDRVKLLGLDTYRFSLEWSKIQPRKPKWAQTYITRRLAGQNYLSISTDGYEPNEFSVAGIEFYRTMIREIKRRNLKIILTINHMSLPDWVLTPPINSGPLAFGNDSGFCNSLRGWENPIVIEAFTNFVEHIVLNFRDDVSYWITLNEPIATLLQCGYIAGIFPPGFSIGSNLGNDSNIARDVYLNLIQAHVNAYNTIKRIAGRNAKVGFSHAVIYADAISQTCLERAFGDNEDAKNQWNYAINIYFLDAVINGDLNRSLLLNDSIEHNSEWANKLDFIAPQYYRSADIYHDVGMNASVPWLRGNFKIDVRSVANFQKLFNDLGWAIYPGGFYQILKNFHDRYKLPILITENGICQSEDRNRAAYTIAHLQQVLRAIKDGVNVIGYVHWSIVDNYEWAFGYQKEAHFGLFTVDRDSPISNGARSFPRHITEGAIGYQYVIAKSKEIIRLNSNEDPFDLPVKRFGTIDVRGVSVQPPQMSFGGLWEIFIKGNKKPILNLYLSRLSTPEWRDLSDWVGMIFFLDIDKWVRLENIQWRGGTVPDEPFSNGILTFRHPSIQNQSVFSEYNFTTFPTDIGQQVQLKGTITTQGQIRRVIGRKERKMGTWKKNNVGPEFITLHHLEGDKDRWHGKYLNAKPEWSPFIVDDISQFVVTSHSMGEDSIYGPIITAAGSVIPFGGTKLPDGIPF